MLTTYYTCILTDVIIVDLTCANLISWVVFSQRMVVIIVAKAKVVSYCDQHLEGAFMPFVVEILRCLHQQRNDFLHQCANMAWSTKGFGGPPLSIIHSFCKQKNVSDFSKSLGCHCLMLNNYGNRKAFSRLGVFPNFPPISLHNLFHATNDEFRSKVSCFFPFRDPFCAFYTFGWSFLFGLWFDLIFLLFPC